MPYSLQLAQINASLGGMGRANTAWGFPVSTNFHTLLMSCWMCGPYNTNPTASGSPGIWPAFMSASFFGFGPGVNSAVTGNPFIAMGTTPTPYTPFYTGNIPNPQPTSPTGCLLHFLMSVDTHAQIVQVYINDQPVTVTGAWASGGPWDFNVSDSVNNWQWDVSNVIHTGIHPALGDAWISNTPSFVDLSVMANRRKFISSTMLPVDLGATGTLPFGYQPAMYMSIRPGGVAADILNNLGVGGGAWGNSDLPPTFQTDGTCVAIPLPPPVGLAMDDVVAIDQTPAHVSGTQVFLMWSDDRGHSYGSPVGQPIGATGAYLTNVQWQRLGMARDRVFKLEWSVPVATALLGAYIEVDTNAKS